MVVVTGRLKEMMIANLSDPESRLIITAANEKPRTAVEMGKELNLPQSTLYRKISGLKECGLLMVEEFEVEQDGRREAKYSCPFSEVRFKVVEGEIELDVVQTKESVEKRWFELFFSRKGIN